MLKFIANFFGSKKAEPVVEAPYKVETPEVAPVVNTPAPTVNGRKKPAPKKTADVATGNTPKLAAPKKQPVAKRPATKKPAK